MRRRITRTLATGAAACVTLATLGLAAAGAAGAAVQGGRVFSPSGGALIGTDANRDLAIITLPSGNCGKVGYQASGRNFRFAQAMIRVPDHAGSLETADPTLYVALDNSGTSTFLYTRAGIAPCPASRATTFIVPGTSITCPSTGAGNTSDRVAFAATADAGGPPTVAVHALANSFMGDGVQVSAYAEPTGNSVHTTITLPDGTTFNNTFAVAGPTYTKAIATADWTTAVENGVTQPQPAVPGAKVRDSQFLQGRFTTASGVQGTFNGPWTLNAYEATSNGSLPPSGTLIGQPSYLWTDGNSFQGQWGDAFGVWRFPF